MRLETQGTIKEIWQTEQRWVALYVCDLDEETELAIVVEQSSRWFPERMRFVLEGEDHHPILGEPIDLGMEFCEVNV